MPIRRLERGFSLLETALGLAIIAIAVPILLRTLSSGSVIGDAAYDRSILFELAQSQMEDVQRQSYQTSPASYSVLSAPSGYSISISTSSATAYTYPAPLSSATLETIQLVTITITGVRGNMTLEAYKVRL